MFVYSNEFINKLKYDYNSIYNSILPVKSVRLMFVFIKYADDIRDSVYLRRLKPTGLKYAVEHYDLFRKNLKEFITEDENGLKVDFPYDDVDWIYVPFFTHEVPDFMLNEGDKKRKEVKKVKKSKYTPEERAKRDAEKAKRVQDRRDDKHINNLMNQSNIDINIGDDIRRILRRGIKSVPTHDKQMDIRFISLDIGVKNFCTVCSNVFSPYLISGRTMTNALGYYDNYYNHSDFGRYAITKKYSGINKRKKLEKRNDILHEFVISVCDRLMQNVADHNIDTIIFGYPEVWSKKTDFGSKDVAVMFQRTLADFKERLKKRCAKRSIKFVEIDEAYTSVSSFVDNDEISGLIEHSGKRVTRDKYFSKQGYSIHADVNASYNIAKKYLIKNKLWSDKYFTQMIAMLNNSRFIRVLEQGYDIAIQEEEVRKLEAERERASRKRVMV